MTMLEPTWEEGRNAFDAGNYEKALEIFKFLAEQGDFEAYGRLGEIYRDGLGLPKDIVLATAHFRVAAQLWVTKFMDDYMDGELDREADTYYFGDPNNEIDLLEKQMTPAEIAETKKLAMKCLERHGYEDIGLL